MRTQRKPICRLASLSLATFAVLALPIATATAAATEMAGESLSLENEMRHTIWQGPVFDLLFGLAIGASVAAVFRAYQIFARRRSPA